MAFFGVTVETIETAQKHQNADRLDVCTLKGLGFRFVTGRNQFEVGESVLYFPVDSILPFWLMNNMNLVRVRKEFGKIIRDEDGDPVKEGVLVGPGFNRIKTMEIRGELSQGIVGKLSLLDGLLDGLVGGKVEDLLAGGSEKITESLGVIKHEPDEKVEENAELKPLPPFIIRYDIEDASRFQTPLELMMDMPVCVTEKIEGSNYSCTLTYPDKFYVNKRNTTILESEKHSYWKVSRKQDVFEMLKRAQRFWGMGNLLQELTVFGEFIGPGVQDNIYGLKEHKVLYFDLSLNGDFYPVEDFLNEIYRCRQKEFIVPVIARGMTLRDWLDGRSIREAADGESLFAPGVKREGIVVTPMVEDKFCEELSGRLILKQRSPKYLAKEKA